MGGPVALEMVSKLPFQITTGVKTGGSSEKAKRKKMQSRKKAKRDTDEFRHQLLSHTDTERRREAPGTARPWRSLWASWMLGRPEEPCVEQWSGAGLVEERTPVWIAGRRKPN